MGYMYRDGTPIKVGDRVKVAYIEENSEWYEEVGIVREMGSFSVNLIGIEVIKDSRNSKQVKIGNIHRFYPDRFELDKLTPVESLFGGDGCAN